MKRLSQRTLQSITIGLIILGVLALALSGLLGQIVGKVIDPLVAVQGWFASRTQAMVEFFTVPRDVATLRQENLSLQNQVSQLQSELLAARQQLTETDILYALLDYARAKPENKYVAASVIGRDPSPFVKYIIINHGSDDGIFKGMPVVTQQGLVGKVVAVTATAARVQLITDPGSVINVRLEEASTDGQVLGSVTGDISLDMVNPSVELIQGDLILTSGLGGVYPSDILIGQVLSPENPENALFQKASVQPVVDFVNLRAVLIITNFRPVDYSPLVP
ncbi:MAG: rod shape-determining protein MreC [Chloroflexi bacterium HGW-Chloroflexi-4]|jgi:rod shape-determining protein MreC|nr:MAG: rod shape-determining protein MreC [Chloroflexi bacterium HGW-Chloroflexi-4]